MSYIKNKKRLAILSLIIANLIWGAAFPIYKLALTEIPPFTFTFLRFFITALILLPFVYKDLKIKMRDFVPLILMSLSGVTLSISFVNLGLKLTSSINAPIIMSATPIVLIIGSFFYLHEKLKNKVILGTLISFVGVLVIVLMPILTAGWDGSVSGNLFIVFGMILSVIFTLLLKTILNRYNFLPITFWFSMIGSVPLIPLVNNDLIRTNWIIHLSQPVILCLLFSIIVSTVIAHPIAAFGIKHIDAAEVGIFSYVDPIAAVLVAMPLLNERISPLYIVAAVLIFGGIFISEGRLHWHPLHRLFR